VSGADESITDEGNWINAELDQYLSEPLISRQDDLASYCGTCTGFITCWRWHRKSRHHHLPEMLFSTAELVKS